MYFCPKCFSNKIRPSDIKQGLQEFLDSTYFVICDECKWTGEYNELLKNEEGENMKRTKLIDKILE